MASHGHSEACCTVPPVKHDYEGKGEYIDVNGIKTYAVGPSTASSAILYVYDIFGFKPQTLQGADILAHADDEHHQYRVFVPDFFDGKPCPMEWYPPDTKDKEQKLGQFFQTTANPAEAVKKVPALVEALTARSGGAIKSWAVVGFCWGGKVITLSCGADSGFKAAASAHPAMVDAKDADNVAVPLLLLPSKDENMDDVRAFEKALKVDVKVEHFDDQVHGWMAARADLKDDHIAKQYQKGYESVLTWFHKYL